MPDSLIMNKYIRKTMLLPKLITMSSSQRILQRSSCSCLSQGLISNPCISPTSSSRAKRLLCLSVMENQFRTRELQHSQGINRIRYSPVPTMAMRNLCGSMHNHLTSVHLHEFSTSCRNNQDKDGKNTGAEQEKPIEKFQYKTWKIFFTVPNLLTFSRVALTPYLGHLVLTESYPAACGIFVYAGVTDVLDGWIARRFPNQASPFGSFMDPLADKFLVSTLFITLTMVNLIPVPLTCLVVARDIGLIAAAFYVRSISIPPPHALWWNMLHCFMYIMVLILLSVLGLGVSQLPNVFDLLQVTLSKIFDLTSQTAEIKPTLISKANTAIQLGLVGVTLLAPVMNFVDHPVLQALWCVTAVTTVWSGVGYMFADNTFQIYKQAKPKEKH